MKPKQIGIILIIMMLFLPKAAVYADAVTEAPLKNAYESDFELGCAIDVSDMTQSTSLTAIKRHFNFIAPKASLTPIGINGSGDEVGAFTEAAAAKNLRAEGFVLISPEIVPEWLNDDITRDEAIEKTREYIQTAMTDFGSGAAIYVVADAFENNIASPDDWKSGLKQSPWLTAIGDDYIEIAFGIAREYAPDAVLYYKDYSPQNTNKTAAVYKMAEEFATTGILDGIGIYGAYDLVSDIKNLDDFFTLFSELDIKINVTVLHSLGDNSQDEVQQFKRAYRYAQLFELFKQRGDIIEQVVVSGLSSLFTENFEVKPIFYAVSSPELFMAENPDALDAYTFKLFEVAEFETPALTTAQTMDDVWRKAGIIDLNSYVTEQQDVKAEVSLLWSRINLYVLVKVYDSVLDASSTSPDKQDSVTVFLCEDMTDHAHKDCAIYTVNYKNEKTFGLNAKENGFTTYARIIEGGYIIQMQIPFINLNTYTHNSKIGFDIQVTDTKAGEIVSIARWNDLSGLPADPARFGTLILQDNRDLYVNADADSGQTTVESHGQSLQARLTVIISVVILTILMCTLIYYAKKTNEEQTSATANPDS